MADAIGVLPRIPPSLSVLNKPPNPKYVDLWTSAECVVFLDGVNAFDLVRGSIGTQTSITRSTTGLPGFRRVDQPHALLDATGDNISFPDTAVPDFVENNLDFSFWTYLSTDGVLDNARIIMRTESAGNAWMLVDNASSNVFHFLLVDGGVQTDANRFAYADPGDENKWFAIAGTAHWTGSVWDMNFYVNGVLATGATGDTFGDGDADTFLIGKRRAASDSPWQGTMAAFGESSGRIATVATPRWKRRSSSMRPAAAPPSPIGSERHAPISSRACSSTGSSMTSGPTRLAH